MRLFLLASIFATACVVHDDGTDSTLLVENNSDFEIHELYVTDVGNSTWGRNLISGDVLLPGEAIRLDVECGTYDALLVDETNTQCELHGLDLCFDDAAWDIRNNTCAVFAQRLADQKASNEPKTPIDTRSE